MMQVQDEAAGLVVSLLDPQPGERILDACAAPGGKALYIAAKMKNQVRSLSKTSNIDSSWYAIHISVDRGSQKCYNIDT